MNDFPVPSIPGLLLMSLPLLGVMAVLARRGLGQVRPLAIAAVRMAAQLAMLGFVLGWVFRASSAWVLGLVALVMLATSAHAVGQRRGDPAWSLRLEAFASMILSVAIVLGVADRLALKVTPWYDTRIVVPLLGMIMGNSVNGIALAAERLEGELRAERDRVETRLALGATSRQAALPALRAAVRAGLTPVINSMTIAGIVAVPGMAAGQLLAGAEASAAMRYQVLVYLAISGTAGLSTLALLGLRLRRYFTPSQQLRADRLERS